MKTMLVTAPRIAWPGETVALITKWFAKVHVSLDWLELQKQTHWRCSRRSRMLGYNTMDMGLEGGNGVCLLISPTSSFALLHAFE